jgi:hypothetical protein
MSAKQPAQAKTKTPKPEPTSQATPEIAQLGPGLFPAGLGQVVALNGLPSLPTTRRLRETAVLQLQRQHGNQYVQRFIQRDDDPKTAVPDATNAPPAPLPTFDFEEKADTRKDQPFDSVYRPVGPAPQTGNLDIYLWVHITYRNFSLGLLKNREFNTEEIKEWIKKKLTDEQKRDFTWQPDEKEKFESGFMKSVQAGWSEKHTLVLKDPQFSEYRARVNVNVISVSDPKLANVKITAQKMPKDAPRIRSFVKDSKAVLDNRDPDVEEDRKVPDVRYVRQVGPFDFDSDKVNEIVDLQLKLVKLDVGEIEKKRPEADRVLFLMGRASAKGDKAYNEDLGMRRANTVETRLRSDMGAELPKDVRKLSFGESNASNDPKFQRVDVSLMKVNDKGKATTQDTKQNVAAHEAGHMFGLGDEYREEVPSNKGDDARFLGDEPSHYQDVRDTLDFEAADELVIKDSGSIMAEGGEVKAGHYVYFVQALNVITGKQWKVEK